MAINLFSPFTIWIHETLCLTLQIIFEAIRGVSVRSDTAIDDVLLQAGPCLGKFQHTL